MPAPRFDISLDGNLFRLRRSEEGVAYSKKWERREVFDQAVRGTSRVILNSRGDRGLLHQTDWSGGAAWWKPAFADDTASMYFDATAMDAFTKPGVVLPTNKGTDPAQALMDRAPMFTTGAGLFSIGATTTTDATNRDIYKFTGADWVRQTGYTAGTVVAAVQGVAYAGATGYVYVMAGGYVSRFLTSGTTNANWLALSPAADAGDNIFLSTLGKIFVYHAGLLKEVVTSGPSLTTLVDDGFGPDLLASLAAPTTQHLYDADIQLAISHTSGIYYAKNVVVNGLPVCFLSRVDRDASGAWVRYPLTTLPPGMVCVNLTVHLGSVVMACTKDWQMLLTNDRSTAEYPIIDFYAYTQGSGLSPLGSVGRERPTEMPARFLGADSEHLYIGSDKRVWVYDGARGGIHPWLNPADQAEGVFISAAPTVLTAGTQALMLKRGTGSTYYKTHAQDPTTVGTFGTDLTTYVIESNYIDFGLPMENKTLMAVDLFTESLNTNQQFTVQIEVDDGAWATAATHSNATYSTTDLSAGSYTGKRFRYKIIYESKTAVLAGARAIQLSAAQGLMIPVYEFVIDGTEIRNVENKVVDPETVYDNLAVTAAKETPITFIDRFRSHRVSDTATETVTVREVEILKNEPNEALAIRVVVVGNA